MRKRAALVVAWNRKHGQLARCMQALLAETGLSDLLTLQTSRRVERVNNLEVWGDLK